MDNRKDLPEVSYSTALDYFVGACFSFVTMSIIQFAAVHFFTKHGGGQVPPETDSEDDSEEELHKNDIHVLVSVPQCLQSSYP